MPPTKTIPRLKKVALHLTGETKRERSRLSKRKTKRRGVSEEGEEGDEREREREA